MSREALEFYLTLSKATIFGRTTLLPPSIYSVTKMAFCLSSLVCATAELTEDMLSSLETFFGNSVEVMLPVGPRVCRCPVGHYPPAAPSRLFTKLTGLMTYRRQ